MMARARSSRLPALFLFLLFCSYFRSISSIHAHSAVWPSFDLDLPHPTAILIFPEPASITASARPGRSRALTTGGVSYAKRVPPWESPTGEVVSFATNISFQITPCLHGSPCAGDAMPFRFTPTVPHGHGQDLGLLSSQNSTTGWCWDRDHRSACFSPATEASGVRSTEGTETSFSPSKNLSSALVSGVSYYLAPHASELSFNCSGSYHRRDKFLGINTTELCDPVFFVFLEEQQNSFGSLGGVGFHNLTGCRITLVVVSKDVLHYEMDRVDDILYYETEGVDGITLTTRISGRVPGRQRYHRLPREPRARRLLSGTTYGRRATRKQHVGKAVSSWSEQAAIAASALVGLICAVAAVLLCCMRSKRPRQSTARSVELEDVEHMIIREPELRLVLGPREFRYGELAAATDNFAEERKIGRGGFGPVYRGYLADQDRHVAIKMLSEEQSAQGLKEFQAEVTVMSRLRHRNIVHLVGWCGRRREPALVYELVPGGSLDAHLYDPDRIVPWSERYKIALGLGSALRYLHTECEQRVVHGDIKPANVMLDASGNAKLGDFGLARLADHGAEPRTTQVVAGTVGYIDPELVNGRRPSAESDVYSFGVVLLEIACGRRPASRGPGQASAALLASVREMHRRSLILDAADPRLGGEFDRPQMERLLVTGLWCAHHDPVRRPSATQAVDALRSEDARLPVLEAVCGSGEIRSMEGLAYGDLPAEDSEFLHDESTETAYLSAAED